MSQPPAPFFLIIFLKNSFTMASFKEEFFKGAGQTGDKVPCIYKNTEVK